jgi:hypothetical protein
MREDYHAEYFGDDRFKKTAPYYSNGCTGTKRCVYIGLAVIGRPKLTRPLAKE